METNVILAWHLKMLVLVTTISVPDLMLVSKKCTVYLKFRAMLPHYLS